MGEPIRVINASLHDIFTLSPFTTDDVDEDGYLCPDIAILLPTRQRQAIAHDAETTFHQFTLHGLLFGLHTFPGAPGNRFYQLHHPMNKGVLTRPVTMREMSVTLLTSGMIIARTDFLSRLMMFHIVDHVKRLNDHEFMLHYRQFVDNTRKPWRVIVEESDTIHVLVESEDDAYVLK